MKRILLIPAALLVLFFAAGCNGDSENDVTKIVFPDTNISFKSHVMPVLAANCALSGCHGTVTGANAAPMYDYYTIVQDTRNLGLVWPGNPDASRLTLIIEYKGALHNPPWTWKINDNQRAGIRKWIEEGAKNN